MPTSQSPFFFENFEQMQSVLYGDSEGYYYARDGSPELTALETALVQLDGFDRVLVFNSGMSAIASTLFSVLNSGDHVLVQREIYGPARLIFEEYLPAFGIRADFVDVSNAEQLEAHILPFTEAIYLEVLSSFTLCVPDVKTIRQLADAYGLLVIADISASFGYAKWHPYLDFAMTSLSKYLAGDTGLLGGAVFCSQDRVQHLEMTRSTLGTTLMPDDALALANQLPGLAERHQQISHSGLGFAQGLRNLNAVIDVMYPRLDDKTAVGGLVSAIFDFSGGQLVEFINNLRRFRLGVSWGGSIPIVTPMTAAYRPEVLSSWGIDHRLVRFYTGIADAAELLDDVEQALTKTNSLH
ncbi:PLP-dependent transferase [Coprothermobacteraceae bacterium]|nr:PLP-dependent transferase [Coprothermobacteraceae bacterium]